MERFERPPLGNVGLKKTPEAFFLCDQMIQFRWFVGTFSRITKKNIFGSSRDLGLFLFLWTRKKKSHKSCFFSITQNFLKAILLWHTFFSNRKNNESTPQIFTKKNKIVQFIDLTLLTMISKHDLFLKFTIEASILRRIRSTSFSLKTITFWKMQWWGIKHCTLFWVCTFFTNDDRFSYLDNSEIRRLVAVFDT